MYYADYIKTVHRSVELLKKDFIWRGKRPKIKHSALIGYYEEDEYKNVDIKPKMMALKIIWINKFKIANDFRLWKTIPNALFVKIGIGYVIYQNYKPLRENLTKISFNISTVLSRTCFIEKQPFSISEMVAQCVWNNSNILKQGSTMFHPRLYKSGIIIIDDYAKDGGPEAV